MNNTPVYTRDSTRLIAAIVAATLAVMAAAPAIAFERQPPGGAPRQTASESPATGPALRLLAGGGTLEPSSLPAVIRIGVWDAASLADDATEVDSDDPITCLTQAIYYEARSESLAGQQAVAQVVINRTRLPEFPSSICGVVFQRTGETSGCQFSFVCDGSMDRSTDWAAWERAREVAGHALGGFVYKPLKNATHYHAAWMTPYWSVNFSRIRQIGGHIFYQ